MRDVLDIHHRHGAHSVTLYVYVHQHGRAPAGRKDLAELLDIAPSTAEALIAELVAANLLQKLQGHDGQWLVLSDSEAQA